MNISMLSIMIALGIFIVVCAALKYFVLLAIAVVILSFVSAFFSRIENFEKYYMYDDDKLDDLKRRIAVVIPEINRVEFYGSNKSFTIDKRTSYICMKDSGDRYYTDNMLTYVILHELGHALSPNKGHTEEWEAIFDSLLDRAAEGGVYDPSIPLTRDYCGY